MHRDAVLSNPANSISLAENGACPVQGFVIPGKVITVQGHPEFTEAIMREILHLRRDAGILTEEQFKSGMDRVADEHDGVDIARAFLRFYRE
jgi:GMP synthase-like glutamine amidotransferase